MDVLEDTDVGIDAGPTWANALDLFEASLQLLDQVATDGLGRDEARAWSERLDRGASRLEAIRAGSIDGIGWSDHSGVRRRSDLVDLLSRLTGDNPRAVSDRVRLAEWLRPLPLLAEAFREGRISRSRLDLIRRIDNPTTNPHLPESQEHLLDASKAHDWAGFQSAVRYWALSADPDGAGAAAQVARRSCTHRQLADGSVAGSFHLDPIAGRAVTAALAGEELRLLRDDEQSGVCRTTSQRRADALVRLVTRGAASAASAPAPLIHLVVGQRVAETALAGHDAPALDPDDPDGRCELVDGTPIHPRYAVALLATASLRRLVLGADSEILDLGRSVRTFPRHLRQALVASARGRCRHPGCTSPTAWLQADHILPWSRNGPTSVANGQALCDPHNKIKRDGP